MNAIEIHGLKKTYKNGTEALKGVDLKVAEGDFFALLGQNGAGKTTLIGILVGLVNKTGGSASVFGIDIVKHPEEAKALIGIVPQEFNFSIFDKVYDIVAAQAGYYGITKEIAAPRIEEVLKALGLWEKRDVQSRALSGGMKRRLMIARALIHKPRLLILDEPTAGVDVELRHGMWQYLRELNASGVTILMTTHYLEEAELLCRNVAIIRQGVIVREGSVKSLLKSVDLQTYAIDLDRPIDIFKVDGFSLRRVDEDTVEADIRADQTLTDLAEALKGLGANIKGIRPTENRLERLFLELTNGDMAPKLTV